MRLADYIPHQQRIMPLLFPYSVREVVEDASSYRDFGCKVVEVLCRSGHAFNAIAQLRKVMPDLIVGAGTVLTIEQAEQAKAAGATYLVSPGTDPVILDYAKNNGLDMIPGVFSPSEVALALRYGFSVQKLFPCEPGGLGRLDALSSPFDHTPVQMVVGSGIEKENAPPFFKHKLVGAVIADWLFRLKGAPLREELAATKAWLKLKGL